MSTIDYYVSARGVIERGNFYNYMHSLGYKDCFLFDREYMINSPYPFGVCIKQKELMVMESATLCYFNSKAGRVKSVEEFKKILNNK